METKEKLDLEDAFKGKYEIWLYWKITVENLLRTTKASIDQIVILSDLFVIAQYIFNIKNFGKSIYDVLNIAFLLRRENEIILRRLVWNKREKLQNYSEEKIMTMIYKNYISEDWNYASEDIKKLTIEDSNIKLIIKIYNDLIKISDKLI